ncbi:MAG: DMT family transporter, partial [Rhodospirillales bacterium]|nr:DMT family transporter [Rhodospirillales bacterium]
MVPVMAGLQKLLDFLSAIPGPVRGALWMLLSAASFAFVSTAARYLSQFIHPFEIAFFRTFFLLVFMMPAFIGKGWAELKPHRWGMQIFRMALSTTAMMAWFSALALLSVAEVTALTFTSPLFATIGAALILGETVRARRWGAVLVGFAGALIVLRPGMGVFEPGAALALLTAVCMAAIALTIKALSRTDSPASVVFITALLTTPATLIPALFVWTMPPLEIWPILVLTGIGAVGVQMGYTKAVAAADVTAVVPFDFSRLIFAAIGGLLVFGEGLDIWTAVGGLVIFSA